MFKLIVKLKWMLNKELEIVNFKIKKTECI